MREYVVIYERGESSWGAYVPDLPGCVAVAETRSEVEPLIRKSIELHIEDMTARGEIVPPPASEAGKVSIPA